MLSLFLVLAPPPREEAKRRQGNPECVSPAASGGPRRATPAFGDVVRSAAGALSVKRGYLIKQPERSCCCSQLLFFTLLLRGRVRPRHATSRVIVPVEAVSPPRDFARSQRSELDGNTRRIRRLTSRPARNGIGRVRAQDLIVVVTSVGTEDQALDIAHALVRNRQAACVNLIPNVHSIYRWKGRVCDDGEFLLIIKTTGKAVRRRARRRSRRSTPTSCPRSSPTAWTRPPTAFASWIAKTTLHAKRKAPAPRRKASVPARRRELTASAGHGADPSAVIAFASLFLGLMVGRAARDGDRRRRRDGGRRRARRPRRRRA